MVYYQSVPGSVQGMRFVATREVPLEKKANTKYIQENVLRYSKHDRDTKRGDDIPTH